MLTNKLKILKKGGHLCDQRKGVSGKIPPLNDEDKENISNSFNNKPELNAAEIKTTLKLACNTQPNRIFMRLQILCIIIKKLYLTPQEKKTFICSETSPWKMK